ncbi:ABC transporter permease [Flavobacteriaceae bacterium]|nr:ABC transporter permease [Flavobacteriaceae bacterium]
MHKLLLIIQREFFTKVKSKSYVVLLFLSPLLMLAMFSALLYFVNKEDAIEKQKPRYLVVANKVLTQKLQELDTLVKLESISGISLDKALALTKLQEYSGLIYVANYSSKIYGGEEMDLHKYKSCLLKNHRANYLIDSGVDIKTVNKSNTDFNIEKIALDSKEQTITKWIQQTAAIGSGYLVMMFVIIYGNSVMRSIIEEKNSRVIEIMISSVKPFQLLLGKILGNAMAGLLQFVTWGSLLIAGLSLFEILYPGVQSSNLNTTQILETLWTINYVEIFAYFIIYFVFGFFLYSSFYTSVGAAVNSETDTQQFVHPILLPLMFGVYIGIVTVLNGNPHGTTATLFSIIPFTSPVVMLMRIPFGVPFFQIITSLTLLILSFFITVFIASKIYRIGILTYGNKPSIKQLVKWMFQKAN